MSMLDEIKALAYKYETGNGWKSNHAACFTLKETEYIIELIEAAEAYYKHIELGDDSCSGGDCPTPQNLKKALKPFTEEKE